MNDCIFKHNYLRSQIIILFAAISLISLGFSSGLNNETLFKCPFRKGTIIKKDLNLITEKKIINPKRSIEILGSDRRIFSISTGTVKKIQNIDGKFQVIIMTDKYTISYEGLDSVYVLEKQNISIEKLIGIIDDKKLELNISKGTLELSDPEKLLDCECK